MVLWLRVYMQSIITQNLRNSYKKGVHQAFFQNSKTRRVELLKVQIDLHITGGPVQPTRDRVFADILDPSRCPKTIPFDQTRDDIVNGLSQISDNERSVTVKGGQ